MLKGPLRWEAGPQCFAVFESYSGTSLADKAGNTT